MGEFHFIRPVFLLLLVGAALVPLLVWLRARRRADTDDSIEPHLRQYLEVPAGRSRFLSPGTIAVVSMVLAGLGAAGPTWERERPPFTQDQAPLVVALDASWSMNAIDIPPTRLARAKDKLRALLAARAGARTALVAYAGTAHLVMPFTEDAAAVELFLPGIEPSVMPVEGKNAAAALALADTLLSREPTPGSILFFTDGIPQEQVGPFTRHGGDARHDVAVLAVGTTEGGPIRISDNTFRTDASGARVVARLDKAGLEALGREADVFVASVTVDDRDVTRVASNIQRHMQAVQAGDAQTRWRDAGYAFVIPIAFLGAFWFRRGWTLRWVGVLAVVLAVPTPLVAQSPSRDGFHFVDLWLTRDQQGRYYFERGDYHEAAARFVDPMWKGVACYRAGAYPCAVDNFAKLDNAQANYDLGNALARQGQYKLAIAAYDRALTLAPGHPDATVNRALVAKAMRRPKPKEEEQEEAPDEKPDKVQFDDKGKKGKTALVPRSLAEVQTDSWLKSVQSDPGEFLRTKFAADVERAKQVPGKKP